MKYLACLFGVLLALAAEAPPVGAQALPRPGARLAFPTEGRLNALVLFVQPDSLADGAGDYGSDPATEWPAAWSQGPERRLPAWAEGERLLARPDTPPEAFDPGSLSAFYHTMSAGRFTVSGYVFPQVLAPAHSLDGYHANRGAFQNGAVALSHELLSRPDVQAFVDALPDPSVFDGFRNGTAEAGADGVFDLVVLLTRDGVLPRLRLDRDGRPLGGSSISSLGADLVARPGFPADHFANAATDAFAPAPLTLGGLRVVDNLTSGSGVLGAALTRKNAVRIVAHELGHRHFGFYHTCDNPGTADADCVGLMGGAYLTMSAGDRLKLGWAQAVPVDLPAQGFRTLFVPDALASGQVLRLRTGADQCGDLILEARLWTNFWDSPPNPDRPEAPFFGNDDGDGHDLFLPVEGLYLYKAPAAGEPRCGGSRNPAYDQHSFSSLENAPGLFYRLVPFRPGPAELQKAYRVGGTYRVGYGPGDTYAPYARPGFDAHPHPLLDGRLTLTNIRREGAGFAVDVWMDFRTGLPPEGRPRLEAYPTPADDYVVLRFELEAPGTARLALFDTLGRAVHLLTDGPAQAGVHEYEVDTRGLSPGTYWARLTTGGSTRAAPVTIRR